MIDIFAKRHLTELLYVRNIGFAHIKLLYSEATIGFPLEFPRRC